MFWILKGKESKIWYHKYCVILRGCHTRVETRREVSLLVNILQTATATEKTRPERIQMLFCGPNLDIYPVTLCLSRYFFIAIGTLRRTLRERQRERHQTKGLIRRTIAVHVRCKSLYISLPSSDKHQREMTKFCAVVWRTWTTTANFSYFYLERNAFVAYSAVARRHNEYVQINEKFQSKIETFFLLGVILAVTVVYA